MQYKGFQLLYFYGGYFHRGVLYAEKQIFCKTEGENFFGTLLLCMLKWKKRYFLEKGNTSMDILKQLQIELGIKASQVENTVKLLDEGNTVPFIGPLPERSHRLSG